MTHILVKFVEDGYHVCPRSTVRYDTEEYGLVSAKYKGSFFRAVVIAEGGQIEGEIAVLKKVNPGTPKRTRTVVRRTWTTPEKHVMKTYFKHNLANGTLLTPDECKDAKFKYSPLRTRTVEQIKAWINNYNKRLITADKLHEMYLFCYVSEF